MDKRLVAVEVPSQKGSILAFTGQESVKSLPPGTPGQALYTDPSSLHGVVWGPSQVESAKSEVEKAKQYAQNTATTVKSTLSAIKKSKLRQAPEAGLWLVGTDWRGRKVDKSTLFPAPPDTRVQDQLREDVDKALEGLESTLAEMYDMYSLIDNQIQKLETKIKDSDKKIYRQAPTPGFWLVGTDWRGGKAVTQNN